MKYRLVLMLSIFLVSCGSEMDPYASDEPCPDTQIVLPDDRGPEPEPEPEEGAVSWAQLQQGALETDCLSCHGGDRSFSSERLFRNSQALNLIRTGDMPPNKVLSQKSLEQFGGFFSQPVIQNFVKEDLVWVE